VEEQRHQKAGVTCVIIGLRRVGKGKKMLFANDMSKVASNINPYLVDSDNVFVLQLAIIKRVFPSCDLATWLTMTATCFLRAINVIPLCQSIQKVW